MTVSSEVSKSGPYTGNGVTVTFGFTFLILDASHIKVVRTENDLDTEITTGFTVSGVGNPSGGSITFSTAPTSAQRITIVRDVPLTQEIDLVNQGAYFAEVVERGLDLAAQRDQQLQEQLDRTVKVPVGRDVSDLDTLIAEVTALAAVAEDITDVAAVAAQVATLASAVAAVAIAASNVSDITNFSSVYLGPRPSNPSTRTNGTALVAGDLFFDTSEQRMKNWTGSAWVLSASSVNGIRTAVSYNATAGQTVFAATYDVGFVDVFMNGVRLRPTVDFTATNGTSITLLAPAALNDEIDIVAFGAFALANMLQLSQNLNDVPNKGAARTALNVPERGQITAADIIAAAKRLSGSGGSSVTDNQLATAAWVREAVFGYMNVTGNAPAFAARALVNFHGVSLNGTYSRTGNLVTVTMAAHGMSTGMVAGLTPTSGGATESNYVITVIDANTFTFTDPVSGSTSGNIRRNTFIRGRGNVSAINKLSAGRYQIFFSTPMEDAFYIAIANSATLATGQQLQYQATVTDLTTTSCIVTVAQSGSTGQTPVDNELITLAIFR